MDFYGFYTGKEFEAYQFLGAHPQEGGWVFRTFAPGAEEISLIGEFNGWTPAPMHRIYDGNFWEIFMPQAREGQMYKYRICGRDKTVRDHCDPYGFYAELRPNTASILYKLTNYQFQDGEWQSGKERMDSGKKKPMNIYEVHAGSFRRKAEQERKGDGKVSGDAEREKGHDRSGEEWYTYRELAGELIPWLLQQGYNYLELLPLSEHPDDASWGYQNTGFYSPTSRYGTPDELRYLIDRCHAHGIGVILDFVPVHFAVDDFALWDYDGTALYEYPHSDVGKSEWGSCNFMHSRGEVRSFLQSCAYYWLKEFHFDGLRMDAVSNLIYWQGDPARGENKMALQFVQHMNQGLKERLPEAILIAEDSSSFEGVTRPVRAGGLGFDYKWDLGWMHDTLSYFQAPVEERRQVYHKLTFSMMYYYRENYLLPLSHDEVVHGKATILQKMNGEYERKFPQARAFYMYMMAHPGKKLNFMGNEIGQLREWDEKRQQDWELLAYPVHDGFRQFMADLSRLYLEHPSFWEKDYETDGFCWIDCHQEESCIYALERRGGRERLAAVFNFSDETQEYLLRVKGSRGMKLLLSSDALEYGGKGLPVMEKKQSDAVSLKLAPFSAYYFLMETEDCHC